MKIFVHQAGPEIQILEVQGDQLVGEVIEIVRADGDVVAWIEELDDPLDPQLQLVDAGVDEFSRLHVGKRRKIEVTVRFGGEPKVREFGPNQTVQRVFTWAVGEHGFDLPASQRPKHTLGLCGSQTEADRRQHLGSLEVDGKICFDLAPKTRYQG